MRYLKPKGCGTKKDAHEFGRKLAEDCDWNGKYITRIYLEALTDANFHTLRAKVARLVNETLSTKLRLVG